MKRVSVLVVGLMLVVSCASTGGKNTVESLSKSEAIPRGYSANSGLQGEPVIEGERLVAVSATVIAMDAPKRAIAIKDSTGDVVTLRVGDRVRNLDRVEVGDKVVASYYVSLAIRVTKEGKENASLEEKGGSAGEIPANVVTEETTSTSAITVIDMDASTIVLQGPYRDVHRMKVRDPGNLANFKVGDHVTITYMEAVAISVDKP